MSIEDVVTEAEMAVSLMVPFDTYEEKVIETNARSARIRQGIIDEGVSKDLGTPDEIMTVALGVVMNEFLQVVERTVSLFGVGPDMLERMMPLLQTNAQLASVRVLVDAVNALGEAEFACITEARARADAEIFAGLSALLNDNDNDNDDN